MATSRKRSLRRLRGRSEERRVGKECRARWGPDHEKKKSSSEIVRGLEVQHTNGHTDDHNRADLWQADLNFPHGSALPDCEPPQEADLHRWPGHRVTPR